MTKEKFQGDNEFNINSTGDVCVGDTVRFSRAKFAGSFRNPTFLGFEIVTGQVTKDSYGAVKQQHTFTIKLADGKTTRIKGRNLYTNGVWRKARENEAERVQSLNEKHIRGAGARHERSMRLASA